MDEKYVCSSCVGDKFLKGHIRKYGEKKQCSYCERNIKTISIETLADLVHEVISEEYKPYDSAFYDEDEMYSVDELISELVRPIGRTNIAEDVKCTLESNIIEEWDGENGPVNLYDDNISYVNNDADDKYVFELWRKFTRIIQQKSRFFADENIKILDSVFRDIKRYKTNTHKNIIVSAGPGEEIEILYRARIAHNEDEAKNMQRNADKELAAPPSKYARAGRMNASGIPVFYAARNCETALAEVRPPVGSLVVVGEFRIIRKIHLLDITKFSELHDTDSKFDRSEPAKKRRIIVRFLKKMYRTISMPVLPSDEERSYIPTQFIAEYLANNKGMNIDGVIFKSSQIKDAPDNKNVVLFHSSSKVAENTEDKPKYIGRVRLQDRFDVRKDCLKFVKSNVHRITCIHVFSRMEFISIFDESSDDAIRQLSVLLRDNGRSV
jgi:hypothetical protein